MKLEIPSVPPSLNKVLNMNRFAHKDLKENWRKLVRTQFVPDKSLHCDRQKMRVKVTLHHSRLYDYDNAFGACKVLFDALRAWNLIWDDSPKYLEAKVEQVLCPHKQRKTVVELEAA